MLFTTAGEMHGFVAANTLCSCVSTSTERLLGRVGGWESLPLAGPVGLA